MSLIAFNKITKMFAGVTVLDSISYELPHRSKVGLVGENGSGKSTILKIIMDMVQPDSGEVNVARSARLWYVPQTRDLRSNRTAYEEVIFARPALFEVRQRMLSLERELNETASRSNTTLTKYAEAVAELSEARGYQFEHEAEDALRSLGLAEEQIYLPIDRLSGGERGRVALAKALLAAPSVLLLDEPDNHLDIKSIKSLEGMLKRYRGAVLLVAHLPFGDASFYAIVTSN